MEPTGATRPVNRTLFALCGTLLFNSQCSSQSLPCARGCTLAPALQGGTHLPFHSLPTSAPPTLQQDGATSQTATLTGHPARHQHIPCSSACATARTGRKQEPCSSLPAVHWASNPAPLAWLKYS